MRGCEYRLRLVHVVYYGRQEAGQIRLGWGEVQTIFSCHVGMSGIGA